KDKNAAQVAEKISHVYEEDALTKQTAADFANFEMEILMSKMHIILVGLFYDLLKELNIDHKTVLGHLYKAGYTKKLDIWVLYLTVKNTKIVGGKETQVNEFPWMVGFMNAESGKIFYGGTIISEQYVITAGHCVVMLMRRFLNRTIVVVGEHDTSTDRDTNATKIYQLSRCITHEYDSSAFVYNSIGICKIVGSIKFSAEVGPVCLPFKHKNDSFTGDKVTALGWGLLEYAGNKSDTLQKVDLDVVPHEECPDSNDTNICTFTLGKDTCVLDEGGPLLWQDPATHNLVLAGIINIIYIFNGSCSYSDKPIINIRTGAHIDWIESVTSGARYCKIE
ncbi:Venom serine protease, partial [Trachymyrmex cornetzi]